VEFNNNAPTCALLEKKRGGVLGLLDEQVKRDRWFWNFKERIRFHPYITTLSHVSPVHRLQCTFKNSSATNFVGILRSQCGSHASFVTPQPLDPPLSFKVRHYAGCVEYEASSFIEKNRDELSEELQTLLSGSSVPFFNDLLLPPAEEEKGDGEPSNGDANDGSGEAASPQSVQTRGGRGGAGGGGGKKRAPTVGQQFKEQVALLMETLQATDPHFIRCLKPNEQKQPDLWDEARMEQQVIFNGIPENIRIAQSGL
jgi:myosin heavy subunit